ncbi:MAG TPA: right-handed parallel beta-helix repeat-containing protein [Thermoplasmata archaeon]|nr:right-handed parallel beta-helix repeat-containing protein [Thermoplasmata archaeon]
MPRPSVALGLLLLATGPALLGCGPFGPAMHSARSPLSTAGPAAVPATGGPKIHEPALSDSLPAPERLPPDPIPGPARLPGLPPPPPLRRELPAPVAQAGCHGPPNGDPKYIVTIDPNGSLSGASAPITRTGSHYRLTQNWTGTVIDERDGTTFDGSGHTLNLSINDTYGVLAVGFSAVMLSNVSLANLTVVTPFASSYSQVLVDLSYTSGFTVSNDTIGNGTGYVGFCAEGSSHGRVSASRLYSYISWMSGGGQFLLLANSTLHSAFDDAYLIGVSNSTFEGNSFNGYAQWIFLLGCTNFSEIDDSLNDSYTLSGAIQAESSSDLLWRSDRFENAALDLFVLSSSEVAVLASSFVGFTGSAFYGDSSTAIDLAGNTLEPNSSGAIAIQFVLSQSIVVFGNGASGGSTDLWAVRTDSLTIQNNTFTDATLDGLNLSMIQHPVVTGNSITGDGSLSGLAGIYFTNSTQLVLLNNQIADWTAPGAAGLDAWGLEESRLAHNNLDGNWYGLYLVGCYFDAITNNQVADGGFSGNGSAFWLFSVGGLNISANNAEFAHDGLWATYGGDSVFFGNDFSFEQAIGVRWQFLFNVTFAGNSVQYDPTGVELLNGALLRFVNNDGSDPTQTCGECNPLYLYDDSEVVVADNNLSNTNVGIGGSLVGNASFVNNRADGSGFLLLVGQGFNLTVRDNSGSDNVEGIEIDQATNVTLAANRFSGPIVGGVRLYEDTLGRIDGTTVVDGRPGAFGLEVSYSTGITLSNDTLGNLSLGLEVDNSTQVSVVAGAFATDNLSFELSNSARLSFVHNNFEFDRGYGIDATSLSSGSLSFNASYPVGGNFWSNFTGPDSQSGPAQDLPGADNIVDHPFELVRSAPDLVDAYPLATPWAYPSVLVSERGLPAGTSWSVRLTYGGSATGVADLAASTVSSMLFEVPYGARTPFALAVPSLPGFVPSPALSEQNTSALQLTVAIVFSPFLSALSFHALGLPANTSWSVAIDNRTLLGVGAFVNLSLANGTYAYQVPAVAGFNPVGPGSLRVQGQDLAVSLGFTPFEFEVLFLEYGLPNGTDWKLTFLGSSYTQTSKELAFSAANGSYAFSVGVVAGFTLASTSGTVEVAGRDVAVQVAFSAIPVTAPPAPAPPSPLPLELGLLALAVVALMAGILLGRRRRPPRDSEPPAEGTASAAGPSDPYYDSPPP